jgi:membrane-bound lytic murein transglycosylase D
LHAFRGIRPVLLAACALFAAGIPLSAGARDPDFPAPETLRPAVGFWKRVYTEITTEAGFLHDSTHLGVVYEVVRFRSGDGRRTRDRTLEARRKHWRATLVRLGSGAGPRTERQAEVLERLGEALGHPPTERDLTLASRRIRFQLGQRDKFRAGLIRSGASEDAMRAVFRERGLPEDLAYLPHVESSFNTHAYSKYGAAGLWQFMRATGRRYMKIDYVVDERLDPMVATNGAARLLGENYEALGSWPLAITAYNHGRTGMRRAVRMVGTPDIGTIVKQYKSRTFGFASRNFYAQFLAARDVMRSYRSWFGDVKRDDPEPVDEIPLPFYIDVDVLHRDLGVPPELVKSYNPALRPPVFRSGKRIPKGYRLRLPAGTVHPTPEEWLAKVPAGMRHAEQHRSRYYTVRRGDNLSTIARRNRTSIGALVAMNNLPSRHRIYAGQVLEIPGASEPSRTTIPRTAHAETAPSPKKTEPVVAETKPTAPVAEPIAPPSLPVEPEPEPVAVEASPVASVAKPVAPESQGSATTPPKKPETRAGLPPPSGESLWRRIDGGAVIVQPDETLGHFADWLEIRAQRLRDVNRLRPGRALHMGQRLRLDFSRVSEDAFIERRIEYHKGIEEDFFGSYRVAGTVVHNLRRGESPWQLAHQVYGVPVWLMYRYNPDLDLDNLQR